MNYKGKEKKSRFFIVDSKILSNFAAERVR